MKRKPLRKSLRKTLPKPAVARSEYAIAPAAVRRKSAPGSNRTPQRRG